MSCGVLEAALVCRNLLFGHVRVVVQVWTLEQAFFEFLVVDGAWLQPVFLTVTLVERYLLLDLIMNLLWQTTGKHLQVELGYLDFLTVAKLDGHIVLVSKQIYDGLGIIFGNIDIVDLSRIIFGIDDVIQGCVKVLEFVSEFAIGRTQPMILDITHHILLEINIQQILGSLLDFIVDGALQINIDVICRYLVDF